MAAQNLVQYQLHYIQNFTEMKFAKSSHREIRKNIVDQKGKKNYFFNHNFYYIFAVAYKYYAVTLKNCKRWQNN